MSYELLLLLYEKCSGGAYHESTAYDEVIASDLSPVVDVFTDDGLFPIAGRTN